MALINKDQVKAEIERRMTENCDLAGKADCFGQRAVEDNDILAFIDTLQEQAVEMDNEEKVRNFFDALGDCGFSQDDILLLKSIWEDAGRQIPQQEQGPDLDSEIFAWQKAHANEDTAQVIAMTARHFAEWGAEHLKK